MLNRTGGVDRIQRRDMGLVSEAYYGGRSVKVVGVGVHGAQRVCWGHECAQQMAHVHGLGMARIVLHQMQREEGGDRAGVTGIVSLSLGSLEDSLTQDTCACFHEWTHARCSSGRQLQLHSGANNSALWDWRGHRVSEGN